MIVASVLRDQKRRDIGDGLVAAEHDVVARVVSPDPVVGHEEDRIHCSTRVRRLFAGCSSAVRANIPRTARELIASGA